VTYFFEGVVVQQLSCYPLNLFGEKKGLGLLETREHIKAKDRHEREFIFAKMEERDACAVLDPRLGCCFIMLIVLLLTQIGVDRQTAAYVAVGIVGSCCLCLCCGLLSESGGDPERATVIVKNSIRRVSFQNTKIQPAGQVPQETAVITGTPDSENYPNPGSGEENKGRRGTMEIAAAMVHGKDVDIHALHKEHAPMAGRLSEDAATAAATNAKELLQLQADLKAKTTT